MDGGGGSLRGVRDGAAEAGWCGGMVFAGEIFVYMADIVYLCPIKL